MSGDLARSLVDAAAEAIAAVAAESGINAEAAHWREESARAVAAVLETLAAHVADQHPIELVDLVGYGKAYNEGKSYVVGLMRRLAVETREGMA